MEQNTKASEPAPSWVLQFENNNALPLLTGTPKQITWARSARFRYISQAAAVVCELKNPERCRFNAFVSYIKQITDAAFWIERSKLNLIDEFRYEDEMRQGKA